MKCETRDSEGARHQFGVWSVVNGVPGLKAHPHRKGLMLALGLRLQRNGPRLDWRDRNKMCWHEVRFQDC